MSNRFVTSSFRFVVAVCLLGIIACASTSISNGKPIAEIKADSYDFGTVFEGAEITHDFIIKNNGDADLEIQNVKAG